MPKQKKPDKVEVSVEYPVLICDKCGRKSFIPHPRVCSASLPDGDFCDGHLALPGDPKHRIQMELEKT